MTNVFGFVQLVGDELLSEYPNFVFKFDAEIAKHVWRDGEMFRRYEVVTVEFVEFFGVFEITFDYVPRVAVGGNIHQINV